MSGRTDVRVERFEDPSAFLDATGDFLVEREAEHNLIFGICANLRADPGFPNASPYLAAIRLADRVVGAAVMTPPWNLVLSCMDAPGALPALAADLDARRMAVPGTTGPATEVARFADTWCSPHGLASGSGMAERIYRLQRVSPPTGVPGAVRLATPADRDLLVAWVEAFLVEALDAANPDEAADLVDRSLRTGTRTWYLWEDGGPVSVAAAVGPTPNGIRIGPVYTPPELRRRGYASAVAAAASQAELDQGRRFVFLFTDLANATSNKIYQAIGYEPVIDVEQRAFVRADPA